LSAIAEFLVKIRCKRKRTAYGNIQAHGEVICGTKFLNCQHSLMSSTCINEFKNPKLYFRNKLN